MKIKILMKEELSSSKIFEDFAGKWQHLNFQLELKNDDFAHFP